MVSILQYPIHPFVFSFFFIFLLYVNNLNEVLPSSLVLPIGLVISIIGITVFLSWILKKNFKKISVFVSLVVVLFFTYGHIFMFFDNIDFGIDLKHRYLLIVYAIIFVVSLILIKSKINGKSFTPILNATALVMLLSITISLPYSDVFNNDVNELSDESLVFDNEYRPDIYYIILDEYAGQKTLKNYFSFDNDRFVSVLEDYGFHVLKNSQSNYVQTSYAAPSTMDMQYVQESTKYSNPRDINSVVDNSYLQNNVMKFLNQNNYKTIYIYGGILEEIDIANENLCGENAITDFHTMLTQTTMLWIIQKYQFINDINQIRFCAFDELNLVGENNDEPIFVFAHIKLPHDPFTISSDGQTLTPQKIDLGMGSAGNKIGYIHQLEFSNKKIVELLPNIFSDNESVVIIIQSDHGVRFDLTTVSSNSKTFSDSDKEIISRSFNNFSAFYFPDEIYDEIYDEITPINTFRVVFNKLFNTDLEILDDKMYLEYYDEQGIQSFNDVTKIVTTP